ncbi:phosphotransferase [Kineosporia sp. J2-2]|uniref:Phosphotransferase n=1 Tax=Kineosporia corallincola TaxID=2835133 RepID=A0ABS5TMI9_9ACTN|nr:phosphotransferase [Kineosporia corallincola]MBT0772297.1 phosphotransferase [Kineosporia corallincola]
MNDERLTAALDWARSVLGPAHPRELKNRPWGATWQVSRPDGTDVFLKASTPHTGHEAALMTVLARVCPDLVPPLVAADPPGHRLIVASAGTVLRTLAPAGDPHRAFDLDVWTSLVQRFADLQRRVTPHAGELLALGVPDERPHQLLGMLRSFTTAPRLPEAERHRLTLIATRWEERGTGLSSSTVEPSVQHGDLHDNNVAVDAEGRARFFDFGDATVAHPFGTMDVPRLMARGAGVDDRGVARLEDAYLEVFTDLAPLPRLRDELRAVLAVAPLHRARNWLRALGSDAAAAAEWDHPVEHWLGRLR